MCANGRSYILFTEPDRLDDYYDKNRKITFRSQIDSDRRKFPLADENGDGKLNRDEMAVFLHPADFPHMRDFVVNEYFNQMDVNKDGLVTKEEYLGKSVYSLCLFVYLFIICLSVCPSVCLSVSLCFE